MVRTVVVDTGFLVALLRERDVHHDWAAAQAERFALPWHTCEAVLAETFHLLESRGTAEFREILRRREVFTSFDFNGDRGPVLDLMQKYADVPMSFADACLVRMTESHSDPIVVTTDFDFRIYRRHSRQVVPCVLPE